MRKEILVDDCEISYCTNTACHTFLNSFVVNYALVKKMSCSFYFLRDSMNEPLNDLVRLRREQWWSKRRRRKWTENNKGLGCVVFVDNVTPRWAADGSKRLSTKTVHDTTVTESTNVDNEQAVDANSRDDQEKMGMSYGGGPATVSGICSRASSYGGVRAVKRMTNRRKTLFLATFSLNSTFPTFINVES